MEYYECLIFLGSKEGKLDEEEKNVGVSVTQQ